MKIIIGTILVLFSLNTILIKYGHITIKRTGRIIMDKAYFITQTLLLWLEHIAMIFSGLVFGLWIAKRRSKKKRMKRKNWSGKGSDRPRTNGEGERKNLIE